jgi:kumamolisin
LSQADDWQARTEIAGSVGRLTEAERCVRPADPNQIVRVTIVIRRPTSPAQSAGELHSVPSSGKTRDEIEDSLSASAVDMTAVTDFAQRYGLTVLEASPAKRMVRVEGPAQSMNLAFGTALAYFDGPNGTFLSYKGPLAVESDVAVSIMAVLGLDQEPVAKSRIGL